MSIVHLHRWHSACSQNFMISCRIQKILLWQRSVETYTKMILQQRSINKHNAQRKSQSGREWTNVCVFVYLLHSTLYYLRHRSVILFNPGQVHCLLFIVCFCIFWFVCVTCVSSYLWHWSIVLLDPGQVRLLIFWVIRVLHLWLWVLLHHFLAPQLFFVRFSFLPYLHHLWQSSKAW